MTIKTSLGLCITLATTIWTQALFAADINAKEETAPLSAEGALTMEQVPPISNIGKPAPVPTVKPTPAPEPTVAPLPEPTVTPQPMPTQIPQQTMPAVTPEPMPAQAPTANNPPLAVTPQTNTNPPTPMPPMATPNTQQTR